MPEPSRNIHRHEGTVRRADRERRLGQRRTAAWLTGLPGSGNSAIVRAGAAGLLAAPRSPFRAEPAR